MESAREFAGNNDLYDLAVSGTHVLLVGLYRAATSIDGVVLPTSDGMADGLVILFDGTDLTATWARTFGAANDDLAYACAAHPNGGFVVTGWFQGSVLFASSGTSLTSNAGSVDAFAARYAPNGDHVWSFRYGGPGSDTGRGIDVMPSGETILAGNFSGDITFGTHTLTAIGSGSSDIFFTRMSAGITPVHEWAVGLGGDTYDSCEHAAIDPAGNAYLVGQFSGMTDIDGMPLTATAYDSWIGSFVR